MLGSKDVMATIAVRDVKVAKKFYEGALGLKLANDEQPEALEYQSGSSKILVYQSRYAGTNKATAATWVIEDGMERVVQALKATGVTFEHYDMPGMTREGDVHVGGNMKAAWFKDPDGNVLSISKHV